MTDVTRREENFKNEKDDCRNISGIELNRCVDSSNFVFEDFMNRRERLAISGNCKCLLIWMHGQKCNERLVYNCLHFMMVISIPCK